MISFYSKNKSRFWELDALRGSAVLSMIVLHTVWVFSYFGLADLEIGAWWYLPARLTAILFFLLVGVCLTISYNKNTNGAGPKIIWHGLKIFSAGLLVTAASYILASNGTVWFGVLHFIGLGSILIFPLVGFTWPNLVLAGATLIAGGLAQGVQTNSSWLIWLGIAPAKTYMLDYFPLLPWISAMLIGVFIGNSVYANAKRSFTLNQSPPSYFEPICLLGRHSLLIYFLHAMILFGVVSLILYL